MSPPRSLLGAAGQEHIGKLTIAIPVVFASIVHALPHFHGIFCLLESMHGPSGRKAPWEEPHAIFGPMGMSRLAIRTGLRNTSPLGFGLMRA
jgi:hypothetical protein